MKKILILNTTHIGTTLCDFPLISRVCTQFKDKAEITVLLAQRNGVLKKYIERKFCCSVEVLDHNFIGLRRYKTILEKILTKWKYFDLGICGLEPRKTDHLLLWAMCKDVIAYVEDNWHGKLISKPVQYIKENYKHRSTKAIEVFSQEEVIPSEWPFLEAPKKKSFKDGKIRLLISMQNNRSSCTLNNQKLLSILSTLHAQKEFTLVINDVNQISDQTRSLVTLLRNIDIECIPTRDFQHFVELVGSCDCCLLGEGGTSHIAAWQRVPQVVLFGQENPEEWGPLATNAICLQYLNDVNKIETDLIINKLVKLFNNIEKQKDLRVSN